MKHEWRKKEKAIYSPKNKPERIQVPPFKYFSIRGEGNPNDAFFGDYIAALYSVSYAIRMSPKKNMAPEGYFEYTVYPLEGIWDIKEEARANFQGTISKDDLVFQLMIRQPDFVSSAYAAKILEITKEKKPNPLLEEVQFETIEDGDCVQMLHIGPYDDEPASFQIMEDFAEANNLIRLSKIHREIYLSDFRKTAPEKLKTVLRFKVKEA